MSELHLPQPTPVEHRSVRRYVTGVLAVGVPLLTVPALADLPVEPFLLVVTYAVLVGGAIVVARRSGPGGVRRLFRGVLRWRVGWRDWVGAVLVLPTATVAVAVATGTSTAPPDGWPIELGTYLVSTLVVGALLLNVLEETAWQGLVQRHLTARHGRLRAAALTAVPFAALHLPLSFVGDVTLAEAAGTASLIVVMAPAMRYVMGRTDQRTGSLLVVGVTHASFNASGQLEVMTGGWQHVVALALVAAMYLVADARRPRGPAPTPHAVRGAGPHRESAHGGLPVTDRVPDLPSDRPTDRPVHAAPRSED